MSDDSSYSRQADHRVFIRAEKAETAKRLAAIGADIKTIATATGLSENEVDALLN